MRVIVIPMIIGDIMMDEDPLEEEGIKIGVEGHWIEGSNHDRGYSRRGRLPDGNGGLPDNEGPPDDGGPPRNGQNPRCPGR